MKKILITGESSFIGTAFLNYINKKFAGNYDIIKISQRTDSWKKTEFSEFDVVLDVTGIAHVDSGNLTEEQEQHYYSINCDLAVETAKIAKESGVKQFIYLSSMLVYRDNTAYGSSKRKAEQFLQELVDESFVVSIVRPPMVYGYGSKGNYPKLSKLAKITPIFPMVRNQRSMIYIEHLCEFLRLLIDSCDGGIFEPQNCEYVNTSEMVRMIGKMNGHKVWLMHGCGYIIRLCSKRVSLVDKVFGDFVFGTKSSYYEDRYQLYSFEETILRTEKGGL